MPEQEPDELFVRDVKKIGKHISNSLREKLDNSVVVNFATTALRREKGKLVQICLG